MSTRPIHARGIKKRASMSVAKLRSRPEIKLSRCQIKDIFTARQVVKAIDILEKRCGIRSVWVSLVDCFICPDITDRELNTLDRTATGALVHGIIDAIRKQEYERTHKHLGKHTHPSRPLRPAKTRRVAR